MFRQLAHLSGSCDRFGDIGLALLLVAIVGLLIVPLPTQIVDGLIALNLMLSTILLMVSLYLPRALSFSTFPSVLLFTTLFRLALNVTTTRLILLHADAGEIIQTFGTFVVGGNFAVGAVIFLIITVVQFVVISKGAERVSEVAARFTLDAMPGKQMSIDADMRAGALTMEQARERRAELAAESQLYGAMDGAMKFVKGDAIAGLVITLINILGGFCIGVFMNGWGLGKSIKVFSILTIGDGLVSQIPALLVAITSGIIVTRVGNKNAPPLGKEIAEQLFSQPKALLLGALIMAALGCLPGFPKVPLFTLAVVVAALGYGQLLLHRQSSETGVRHALQKGNVTSRSREVFAFVVPLLLDVDAKLRDKFSYESIQRRFEGVRQTLYMTLGVPFPELQINFNETLVGGGYRIFVYEVPIADGVFSDCDTAENALEKWGLHLENVLKKCAADFVSLQETRLLLERLEKEDAESVREVQRLLPIQKLTEVLQRLVQEEISIRHLRQILHTLIEWGQKEKDPILLVEYVRSALARYISYKYADEHKTLVAYVLDSALEEQIRQAIRQTSGGCYLALSPETVHRLLRKMHETIGDLKEMTNRPVIVVPVDIRRYFRKMIERDFTFLPVLSYQELSPDIQIQPLGHLQAVV